MKRGTPDHPKVLELQDRLGIGQALAVGLLEMLWHWTSKYAPSGDVGRWSDQAIARGSGWDGEPGAFVEAMVGSGWIDRVGAGSSLPNDPPGSPRLVVHDWTQHADDAVHMALARAGGFFWDGSKPRMTRLSETERERLDQAFYRPDRLAGARRAHAVRTESAPPSPPLPCPALPGTQTGACETEPARVVPHLPAYLDALREHHPRFANEFAVTTALAGVARLLPPIDEFVDVLLAWRSSGEWVDRDTGKFRFAPRADKWIREGGFRSYPPGWRSPVSAGPKPASLGDELEFDPPASAPNWNLLRQRLRDRMSPAEFAEWIEPLVPVGENADELVLAAPNPRFVNTLEEIYRDELDLAAASLGDATYQVRLVVGTPRRRATA